MSSRGSYQYVIDLFCKAVIAGPEDVIPRSHDTKSCGNSLSPLW
jgi:hypothetical protein